MADFDAVVIHYGELADESTRTNVPLDRVPSAEQFARLIFSPNSTIIAIGNPVTAFGSEQPFPFGGHGAHFVSRDATWWLPVHLPVKPDAGEAIRDIDPDWQFWFDHVPRFTWHFWNAPEMSNRDQADAGRDAVPWAEFFVGKWRALATTRYGDPLAIEIEVVAARDSGRAPGGVIEYETLKAPGRIYWLPATSELGIGESITMLLRDVLHVDVRNPPPDWLGRFGLPKAQAAAAAVVERATDVENANTALQEAQSVLAAETRFDQLLYEQGKDALEPVVREALRVLGADVEEPRMEGIEDGRLSDPSGRPGMLEIKGRRGQLKLEDVRQLDGWMRTAIADEGWEGKGVLVANLKLDEPPDLRSDVIAPNASAFAERVEIAVVTTSQLYEALRQFQEGSFDARSFWDAIFATSGLVGLPGATPTAA